MYNSRMKISEEDYLLIKNGIRDLLKQNGLSYFEAYQTVQGQHSGIEDMAVATMWRLFNKAEIQGGTGISFCCQILYKYLDDTHINTALCSIAKDLL